MSGATRRLFMKRTSIAIAVLALVLVAVAASAEDIKITYWQYFYESKVNLMTELIQKFEAQNPGIKVEQVTFPYESYLAKVAAAVPAGEGPDVINLFYGWLPLWVKSGYIQPLSPADFSADYFKNNFYPLVAESVNFGGKNYSVPTAVRALALFYNKKLSMDSSRMRRSCPSTTPRATSCRPVCSCSRTVRGTCGSAKFSSGSSVPCRTVRTGGRSRMPAPRASRPSNGTWTGSPRTRSDIRTSPRTM
jgi:hypothetical protein